LGETEINAGNVTVKFLRSGADQVVILQSELAAYLEKNIQ
jgi:hypothetical protein